MIHPVALTIVLLIPVAALAQERCAGPRTISGACVAPAFADEARGLGLIMAQPKLSQTQPPIAIEDDRLLTPPRDYIETTTIGRFAPTRASAR